MPDDAPRPGTTESPLEVRVARLEAQFERMDGKVDGLGARMGRIESHLEWSEKLDAMHFDQLKAGLEGITNEFRAFSGRIGQLMTGEVELPQQTAQLAEWKAWRDDVDSDRDGFTEFKTQGRFLGRLVVLFTGGSLIGTGIAIYAAFFK